MKLAPPPDREAEHDLSPALRRALDEYVALERRVRPVASGRCAETCAACRTPCCRAAYCEEAWEAPWLRAATSRPGAVRRVASALAIEGHLARDGCRLRFGRPPVCYEYACHDVIRTLATEEEKYLFRAVSHLMTFAGEEALPGTHLVEVTDLSRLGAPETARLRKRIALAGRVLDAALRLLAACDAGRPGAGDPADWALLKRYFPSNGYRLSRLEAHEQRRAASGGTRTMRKLPLLGTVLAAALLLGGLSGCGGPPMRLELTQPKPAEAGTFRDDDVQFRFKADEESLRVEIFNRGKEPIVIPWDRARFVDASGEEREVVAYAGEPTADLLRAPQPPLELAPRATWTGTVHPRDRLRPAGGSAVRTFSLLTGDEAQQGKVVGLNVNLDVGVGRRPVSYEFRFQVKPPAEAAPR
jgi:hypothetical protein